MTDTASRCSTTPLSYCLIVTSPLYGQQGAATALNFSRALLKSGHKLKAVFFYQDGVSNALATSLPAGDEVNLAQQWRDLHELSACELLVCSAAAYRRGVMTKEEACSQTQELYSMIAPFKMAGLAEMTMLSLQADRVIKL